MINRARSCKKERSALRGAQVACRASESCVPTRTKRYLKASSSSFFSSSLLDGRTPPFEDFENEKRSSL